jgi:hypothetical protein
VVQPAKIITGAALSGLIAIAAGVRLFSPTMPIPQYQQHERDLMLEFSTIRPGDAVVLNAGARDLLGVAVKTRTGREAVSLDQALSTGTRVVVIDWTSEQELAPVHFHARIREVEGQMGAAGLQHVRRMVSASSEQPGGQWTIFVGDPAGNRK